MLTPRWAASGSGASIFFTESGSLSAVATSCATCQSCVSVSAPLKARHSGQPNSIGSFPIALLRRVIGHAFAFEKQRRMRVHVVGYRGRGLIGQAVAHGALILINFRAGKQDFPRSRVSAATECFALSMCASRGLARHLLFKRHRRIGRWPPAPFPKQSSNRLRPPEAGHPPTHRPQNFLAPVPPV